MSDAQEVDFQQYLDGRRPKLEGDLHKAREHVLATASATGTLGSGATLKHGVAKMELELSGYLMETMALADRWSGPALPIARARAMIVAHLSSVIADLATAETAYRVGSRRPPESALRAMEVLVGQSQKKARCFIETI